MEINEKGRSNTSMEDRERKMEWNTESINDGKPNHDCIKDPSKTLSIHLFPCEANALVPMPWYGVISLFNKFLGSNALHGWNKKDSFSKRCT